jgi:glutathione S-transferase
MADCAAAPSLFYADWVHEIGPAFPRVRAYRSRLLARPSFARAVDEGRPYRHYFPSAPRSRLKAAWWCTFGHDHSPRLERTRRRR